MAAPLTTTLNSLDDDVLGAIFLLLPPMNRAEPVPRVCRRWHRITAHASLWPVLRLTPRDSSMVTWLRHRSPGLRHLILQGLSTSCHGGTQWLHASSLDITRALAAVAPSATQLQQLQLLADHTEDERADSFNAFDIAELACISHLRGLTSLTVHHIGTPLELASLNSTLACLHALEVVSLEFRRASDPAAAMLGRYRPMALKFPSSLLRCTALTSMDLSASFKTPYACSIPADITALRRLQHLGLEHCVRAPLPRNLSQMSWLTSLKIAQYMSEDELLFRDPDGLVPLPTSLRALDVALAPVQLLRQLTALQRLRLTAPVGQPSDPSCFSMLEQLTSLELSSSVRACWEKFTGCTGLRALHLHHGHDEEEPHPLPFWQLTRLQLQHGSFNVRDVLIMVSDLPRLEVLEMLEFMCREFELRAFDATALSRLPNLRLVNLSGTTLWGDPFDDDMSDHQAVQGYDMVQYVPLRVLQQLLHLQRVYPNITWVVDEI